MTKVNFFQQNWICYLYVISSVQLVSSAVVKCRAAQRIISIYMVCVHIHANTLFCGKASLCEQL